MARKGKSLLLLVVLCTLLVASTTSGVSNAASSSNRRLDSGGNTPDDNWDGAASDLVAPPPIEPLPASPERNLGPGAMIPAALPQLEPAAPPPDDNWDGTAPALASPSQIPAVPASPDQNLALGVSAPEVSPGAAPQSAPAATPPDDNWDGTASDLVAPPQAELIPPSPERNLDSAVLVPAPLPQLEPAGPPPDDNWDGAASDLASPPETPPVSLPPDQNIAPEASAPEAPPTVVPGPGDSRTLGTPVSMRFPATGDTINVANNPYWWHAGDYAQGVRTPGLKSVAAAKYDLTITDNVLKGTGHVDLELSINGVVVGSFTVLPGQTFRTVTFFFPAINGPNYTIRLRETNTVDPLAGSIVIPLDTSSLTLYDSTTSAFPATGDTINVANNPFWWIAGDYAQGVRTPGLSRVTGVRYDLMIADNVLSGAGHVDLDLSINGVVVGSFTVLPGETFRSVSFFFPPISGPSYTIRLRETNTVASGLGSIVIPLNTSPITFYNSTPSPFFPASGDIISVAANPYWWNAGDYAQGVRTPGLSRVNGVRYNLTINNNVLSGTGHVDLELSINGVVVGSFTVLPGQTSRSVSFSFPAINGPNYTVRLRETNTVDSGAGSIVIPLDTSPITFYDSTRSRFFPATGDTINVANNPYWWIAGDYAQGVRTVALNRVTGVRYDLTISNNVLNGTGRVDLDLSINGVVVGSFTVLPGQMSRSVSFLFPPIIGPSYTIRLRETNTVDPGAGSIAIPLDTSPILLTTSVFVPLVMK